MKTAAQDLADNIRRARRVLGLTQTDLGALLGCHAWTVQNWERGKPPRGTLHRSAAIFLDVARASVSTGTAETLAQVLRAQILRDDRAAWAFLCSLWTHENA